MKITNTCSPKHKMAQDHMFIKTYPIKTHVVIKKWPHLCLKLVDLHFTNSGIVT